MIAKIRGMITSTSRNIEINPTLSADDFDYPVPPGVRLVPMITPQRGARKAASSTEANQRNACINNLRQIDAAKQQWALENGKGANDTPTEDNLKPYLPGKNFPVCLSGGKYTIGKASEPPTCSIPGHALN